MASNPRGPSAGSTAPTTRSGSDDYVEFYLANMWTWTPSGKTRVLEFFRDLNSAGSTYTFESGLMLRVRCMRKEKDYIQRNFIKLQGIIEDEIQDMEAGPDGILIWGSGHADIERPEVVSNGSRFEGLNASRVQMPDRAMTLDVPDEIRDFPVIVAWQDLQAKEQVFDTVFISAPTKRAIEEAHDAQLVSDLGYKVVFIGAPSREAADMVKIRLTILLQDHLKSLVTPLVARHVFCVRSTERFGIDVRDVTEINPILARSTILDPWHCRIPEKYLLFNGAVFCLRICREDPLRSRYRNRLWSLFGPRTKSVIGEAKPNHRSQLFKGLGVPQHLALPIHGDEGVNVNEWRNKVAPNPSGREGPNDFDGLTLIDLDGDTSGFGDTVPRGPVSREPAFGMHLSILDQNDPVLQDSTSTLQRALLPVKRTITVQHPDFLPVTKVPTQKKEVEVEQQGELDRLLASLKALMEPMRRRRGIVSLRAEIGRYYAHDVAPSGRASNPPEAPADPWCPKDLRPRLEKDQPFFFTKALSCWGNDIDFIANMTTAGSQEAMWLKESRAVFVDFLFQVPKTPGGDCQDGVTDMVLEVDAQDYTWTIRHRDSTSGLVYCHCLDQHWDFRVRVSRESPLELEEHWGRFAQALINSLEVKAPKVRFQHSFHEALIADCPIVIRDVRLRQVCRLRHRNLDTCLDITRVLPTKVSDDERSATRYRRVQTLNCDDPTTGAFSSWYEASVASARFEELLKQNERLVPGDEAEWTVEQLEEEEVFALLAKQTLTIVEAIDGVGVLCDNGHEERKPKNEERKHEKPDGSYEW